MADFPLACNVQGDCVYRVTMVDDNDAISEVIRKAADQLIGVIIPPFPDNTVLEARIHGCDDVLSETSTVKDIALVKMEALDISVRA